ncbi:hypothetical protein CPB86DRAFT_802516 [Serendipita vermifera]|nr:hypothetical protein CPB86DRAFT_802516 [Serendipita vermifera]
MTRLDYDPGPIFATPTHHKLSDSHTVKDILETFNNIVGFDAKLEYNGFLVSIPIGSSPEQRSAFYDANYFRSCDHFHVWANLHASNVKKCEGSASLLFIDLTPGQVASKLATGSLTPSGWGYHLIDDRDTSLGDVSLLSTQDIWDKLVTPVVSSGVKVHRVGILRPEGVLPGIPNAEVEALFVDTPVDWVTLDGLSRGAAFVMTREPTSPEVLVCGFGEPETTYVPSGITLANGDLVTIVPDDEELPTIQSAIFTTSQDNQTTVTVRLNRGVTFFGDVALEGLIPRAKSQAAIRVTVDIKAEGDTVVTVEELGTDLKKVENLGNIIRSGSDAYVTYRESSRKQVEMTFGQDGIVGELPE